MTKKIILIVCILLVGTIQFLHAQIFPDTIWMPVTYYDFHSNKSNPEFECDHIGWVRHNMVADYLDAEQKPIVGSNPYLNYYIKYWYRNWLDSAQGDYTIPKYRKTSGGTFDANIVYDGPIPVDYDTAFKNIVIYDSLPFEHIGNGVYTYRDDNFFPLDNRGFGNEGKNNNFSFAMELQTTFIMKQGLTFNFRGDDDVWAYINNKLAMDLGGIHSATNGSFLTDTISGLVVGQEYPFSFFFAERHTNESHIWITTNIVSTHIVNEVTIVAEPATATIPAGGTVTYTGTVWYDSTDGNGVVHHLPDPELSQNITWSYVSNNPASNPAHSSLSTTIGSQTVFTSTEAYETFTVTASYEDPISHQITTAQMTIQIIAGPPNHVSVEATSDTSLSLAIKQNDQPLDTLTISAAASGNHAFAMIRDQYGNFINYSKHTTWSIISGTVLASVASGNAGLGEGVATKHGPSGIGRISARDLDYNGASYTDTCVVRVLNEAPLANNDIYTTPEDVSLTIPGPGKPNILANDVDIDPLAVLSASIVTTVAVGVLNLNSDGSFTYVPPTDYNGNVVFTYKAFDGQLYSNIATVTIMIGANNDPPQANNDSYTTAEDTQLSIASPGVLLNDQDIDGNTLTAVLVATVNPLKGALLLNQNGSFVYTPAANFKGTVTFTYQAFDGTVNSNVATVTITVTSVNDAPVAQNDNYVVNEDNILAINPPGVLANDYDVDSTALTATLLTTVAHGTLALNANGSFTYTPAANYSGPDSYTYRASDGEAVSVIATVSISVIPQNDLPIAANDQYSVSEDNTLTIPAAGVLANDIDMDGNPMTAILINSVDPAQGTLVFNPNGSFVYTPPANYNGTAMFTYRAHDGTGYSNTATVMLFITPSNDMPVANNDAYSTIADVALTISAVQGVLSNDNDIDGDQLTAELVTDITAAQGTLALAGDGSFIYTPASAYTGTCIFTYSAKDDSVSSNIATVSIFVGDNNHAPVAINDNYTTTENTTLSVPAPGVLSNDSDPDLDALTAVLISTVPPANGTLTFNTNGSFTFSPNTNFNGTATFTYEVFDSKLHSTIATVTITVTPINDAPVANNDAYTIDEDIPLNVPANGKPGILANDIDIDGDPLSAVLVTGIAPAYGSLTLSANGSFVFVPAANVNGAVSFSYKATDGTDTSAAATVTIVINAINDAPVVVSIPDQTIGKGGSFQTIKLDDYVSDIDNTDAQLTWTTTGASQISVTINTITHIATLTILDTNWIGSESITFTARDSDGLSGSDIATFTVIQLSRLPMPETDTVPGTYTGSQLTMNLYVSNYASASINYTTTTNGTVPPDPKTVTPSTITGNGVVSFGPFTTDSTRIKVLAYASQQMYDKSENRLFEYLIVFPKLPAPVATPVTGQYDTTGLSIALSVPGHADAQIYYTLDGTDPATSATRIHYNVNNAIRLGPFNQIAYVTIRVCAVKTGYKSGAATFEYVFNPSGLPKPVADPAGHTFHTDSIQVRLTVPGVSNAEIRYTTDGSLPSVNSDLFTGPITIKKNTTLKAIAVKDGSIPGPVMTENYLQSLPTTITLFPNTTTPTPYPATVTCSAGVAFPLVAKIFDQYDSCLTSYLTTTAPITWTIQEISGGNTGSLSAASGHTSAFEPIKAYNTVKLIATFSENGHTFTTEITLIITPGTPYKIWLESDHDWHISPNTPNPVDTVYLSNNKTTKAVYAIVRDSLGNWALTSKNTLWAPTHNTTATVLSGKPDLGEGIITKGTVNGTVIVSGRNTGLSLVKQSDSLVVVVQNYWYDSLRIVVKNDIRLTIDSLTMNTNQDSSLYVFGHRDDGGTPAWEQVSARWELVGKSLEYIIANPPSGAHKYLLSPVDTASGRIRVTLDNDTVTSPDTVSVRFTPGAPMRVEFTLLTPDSLCFAGDTLTTLVKLYNGDNKLVYGAWQFPGNGIDSSMYDDVLGTGNRPMPFFIADAVEYPLRDQGSCAFQTFLNGIDTVSFVLYYAPYDKDSLHQLSVLLDYTMKATTRQFRLLPGTLKNIDIVVDNTKPDTISISSNSGIILKTIGYDPFGNIIDIVICNWATNGGIPSILFPDSTRQIYYNVGAITYQTKGYIYTHSILDSTILDSVFVIISSRPATLVKAVTRDINGNGYLDAVTFYFDKKVALPDNTLLDNLLTINYGFGNGYVDILIDSLVPATDSVSGEDSIYTACFSEYTSGDEPQTAWLPVVSLTGITGISPVTDKKCVDGAPVVVWKVVKIANTSGDTEKDEVYVTLSEPFVNVDGSSFMYAAVKPATLFNVWYKSSTDFILVDSILAGITNFTQKDNTTLKFLMTNGENITSNNYFNLVYQDSLVADIAYNTPAENNQKVQVQVQGTIDKIVIGPNPVIPTLKYYTMEKGMPLAPIDRFEAYNRVKTNGGSIIIVDIELSSEDLQNENLRITGQLMIFDVTGNLVHAKENRDNLLQTNWQRPTIDDAKGTMQLAFYWDGISDRGMKAAPGIYRTMIYIKFKKDVRKIQGILAIGR